jgi:hypothetical protein
MSRPHREFYRATFVRYAFVLTGMFAAYALSPWAPGPWHDTASLRFITAAHCPLSVLSAGFAVYVLLQVTGNLLGLWLYLIGFVALAVTIRPDRPTNGMGDAAVLLAIVLHFAAARLAIIAYATRDTHGNRPAQ